MLTPLLFLLGLALLVTAVFGLAGIWWAVLASGLALVLVAWLGEKGQARLQAPGRRTDRGQPGRAR